MTKRMVSAFLVGLGVALVVAALLVPRLLQTDGRLPLDLENSTWTIVDPDATAHDPTDPEAEPYRGEVTHQTHVEIMDPADSDTASVRVGDTWVRGDSNAGLLNASTYGYVIDRVTGEAVSQATLTHTLGMPTAPVDVPGHWFKLPIENQAETIELFDATLRTARPATMVGSEEFEGRQVDIYHQVIEPTNVARLYPGPFNTRTAPVSDGGTEQLYLFHQADRTVTVDHVSGVVVDVEAEVEQFYGRADGTRVQDALSFNGAMLDEQTQSLVHELQGVDGDSPVDKIRSVVIAVGSVLALIGIVLAFIAAKSDRADRPQRRRAGSTRLAK